MFDLSIGEERILSIRSALLWSNVLFQDVCSVPLISFNLLLLISFIVHICIQVYFNQSPYTKCVSGINIFIIIYIKKNNYSYLWWITHTHRNEWDIGDERYTLNMQYNKAYWQTFLYRDVHGAEMQNILLTMQLDLLASWSFKFHLLCITNYVNISPFC